MGAGLGPVDKRQKVFMVIRFKGEITATEASDLNDKLNDLLTKFNTVDAKHGGSGHVNDNNADDVNATYGGGTA